MLGKKAKLGAEVKIGFLFSIIRYLIIILVESLLDRVFCEDKIEYDMLPSQRQKVIMGHELMIWINLSDQ